MTESGAETSAGDPRKRAQFAAVKRWFDNDWMRIEPKLRTSIVEGISVFLSLFDDNPSVKHTFCPPKETYDPEMNRDGSTADRCRRSPSLIETGKVVALNFPVATNPGLARTIGTLLKQDFQRAMIGRIPRMEQAKDATFGRPFSCATNTRRSRRAERAIRPATRSSSHCPARPSAFRSSRLKASARCGPLFPGSPGGPCSRRSGRRSSCRCRTTSAPGRPRTCAAKRSSSS